MTKQQGREVQESQGKGFACQTGRVAKQACTLGERMSFCGSLGLHVKTSKAIFAFMVCAFAFHFSKTCFLCYHYLNIYLYYFFQDLLVLSLLFPSLAGPTHAAFLS